MNESQIIEILSLLRGDVRDVKVEIKKDISDLKLDVTASNCKLDTHIIDADEKFAKKAQWGIVQWIFSGVFAALLLLGGLTLNMRSHIQAIEVVLNSHITNNLPTITDMLKRGEER